MKKNPFHELVRLYWPSSNCPVNWAWMPTPLIGRQCLHRIFSDIRDIYKKQHKSRIKTTFGSKFWSISIQCKDHIITGTTSCFPQKILFMLVYFRPKGAISHCTIRGWSFCQGAIVRVFGKGKESLCREQIIWRVMHRYIHTNVMHRYIHTNVMHRYIRHQYIHTNVI